MRRSTTVYANTVTPLLREGGCSAEDQATLANRWLLEGAGGEVEELLRRIDAEDLVVVRAEGELVRWQ